MGFRDDNEALRQRVQALEGEVETLTEELEEAKTPKVRVELDPPKPVPPDADLAKRVAAQEAKRAHVVAVKQQRELEAKQKRRHEPREAKIVAGEGETHLTLKRSMFGQLRKKLGTTLLMFPAFAGAALPLALVLESLMPQTNPFYAAAVVYTTVYVLGTLLHAYFKRPQVELHIGGGNFELANRGRSRMIGRTEDLRISVSPPTPDGRSAGRMQLSCRGDTFTIEDLSLADTEYLAPLEYSIAGDDQRWSEG